MPHVLHVIVCMIAAIVGGALWAGIAGVLKATTGTNEVISTIMLNWIAIYATQYLFAVSGPLTDNSVGNGVSKNIKVSAQYPGLWGVVQQIHIGIFLALGCAVLYYVLLNRTTLGYEVRAVGFNPEAARYGGISVGPDGATHQVRHRQCERKRKSSKGELPHNHARSEPRSHP